MINGGGGSVLGTENTVKDGFGSVSGHLVGSFDGALQFVNTESSRSRVLVSEGNANFVVPCSLASKKMLYSKKVQFKNMLEIGGCFNKQVYRTIKRGSRKGRAKKI